MQEDYTKISVDVPHSVKAELQLRGRRHGGLKVSPYACQLICKALSDEIYAETYHVNGYLITKLKLTKPLRTKDVDALVQTIRANGREVAKKIEAVS